jgi:hypothetical protein
MKATKEGALRRRRHKGFSEELFLPALDAQIFIAREFFLRCFASILVAIISTYLHCPHTRLLMFVSEKKTHFFFSKRSARFYELLAFDLVFLMYFNSKRINRSHVGGREGRDVSGLPSRSSRSSFPGCFLL